MTDSLHHRLALRGQLTHRNAGVTRQKILHGTLKPSKTRGIEAIGEIRPHRSNGRLVPDAESGGMHHVIEILKTCLMKADGNIANTPVNISCIPKQNSANVLADQRITQLDVTDQQRISTQRESGRLGCVGSRTRRSADVAGTSLILGKAAMRNVSAAEKALRQRH